MVFCDISKAFDRVWHTGLLFKLKQHGINDNILYWIKDYLNMRSQRVVISSSCSEIRTIKAGVPQGSVLGPLLFLIYVNDIADNLLSVTRLFADDSSLAISSEDIDYMEFILNDDLITLNEWSKQWLVKLNPNKTEVIFFSLGNHRQPNLYFNDTRLNFVTNHKHLGLTLSENGKWHEHINSISKSASKVLSTMRALKFELKRDTLNQIYISYMRPLLEYGSIVWDGCTQNEKETLEKLQLEAARVVTGLTRSAATHCLLKEIGWISLENRRKIQKLVTMYKAKTGNLPDYLNVLIPDLVSENSQYNLRSNDDYVTLSCRTQIYYQSFIPSSVRLWNELSLEIRNSPSLNIFKNKLKSVFQATPVPTYFNSGDRIYAVFHARIRNCCSNLNYHLYVNHLRDHPF